MLQNRGTNMAQKAYIICQKCGSDEMEFIIDPPDQESCGVYLSCHNCAELTSVEEWNEFNDTRFKLRHRKKTNVISFRAECAGDVEILKEKLSDNNIIYQETGIRKEDGFPDVEVQFTFLYQVSLETIFNLMREAPDSYVMLETLRPLTLSENSCKRRSHGHNKPDSWIN